MKILIIDEDSKKLNKLEKIVKEIKTNDVVVSLCDQKEINSFVLDNQVDVAIINNKLVKVANKIVKKNEKVNLIFINDEDSYNKESLSLKASAYLFNPVNKSILEKEFKELRYPVKENEILLRIQCFGNFSVFDKSGKIIRFSRSKAREMLAYLVYKCGSQVTTKELGAILFEDQFYDSKQKGYLQQIFHALNYDLKEVGAEGVLVKNYNSTSIDVSKVDCDYFRFNKNEELAKRLYNGEFMMQYEWADYVSGYLDRRSDS